MSEKSARSSVYTGGDPSSIGRRSLRYSVGHTREQIERPLVAIVNTWNEVHPGHCHLQRLAAKAKEGVLMAGGMPVRRQIISDTWTVLLGEGFRSPTVATP